MKNQGYWIKRRDAQKNSKDIIAKANRFVDRGCIHQISELEYACFPVPGYNTKTYQLMLGKLQPSGRRMSTCDCQGFRNSAKKNMFPTCSHIEALMLYLDEDVNRKRGVFKDG